jgi:deoxyhypusine synthase
MHQGNAQTSDIVLRDEEVVRIYDIFFDYSVLLDTDAFFRRMIEGPRVPKADVDRRVSLSRRTLRSRARAKNWE